MTKSEFIQTLEAKLNGLPQEEICKSTTYYSEQIEDRKEDGMTEEQAVADLESIDIIAQRIIDDYNESCAQNGKKADSNDVSNIPVSQNTAAQGTVNRAKFSDKQVILIIVLVVTFPVWIGLLAGACGVYIGLWGGVIGICAATFGLFVAAVACLISLPFSAVFSIGSVFMALGSVLLLFGLSFLFGFGAFYAAKGLIKLLVVVCRGLEKLFKRLYN